MNSSTRSTSPPFFLVGVVLLGLVAGCAEQDQPVAAAPGEEPLAVPLTVLALGDSYTKGESLPAFFSWPRQLADTLAVAGDTLQSLKVLAETGWTTRDLLGAMRAQADQLDSNGYGLVTLMIGVNNQFQHLDRGDFAADMDTLVAEALRLAAGDPGRVLGFSIPDYGATPVGQLFGGEAIAADLAGFNAILARKFAAAGIAMLDVTTPSLLVAEDPALLSRDGLHYSSRMYALWVELMLPAVRAALDLG